MLSQSCTKDQISDGKATFVSLLNLYSLKMLFETISSNNILRLREIIPEASETQQLQILQQMQSILAQALPNILSSIQTDLREQPISELNSTHVTDLLNQQLNISKDQFHVIQPLKQLLLKFSEAELPIFQEAFSKLESLQLVLMIQILRLDVFQIFEIERLLDSQSTTTASTSPPPFSSPYRPTFSHERGNPYQKHDHVTVKEEPSIFTCTSQYVPFNSQKSSSSSISSISV
jgi:hypothetical protein